MECANDWNDKGIKFYENGFFDDALNAFLEAIRLNPNNPVFWKNLGDCQYDLHHIQEGFSSYKKAIELDNRESPEMLLDFGKLYILEKKYPPALKILMECQAHKKTSNDLKIEIYETLSECYYYLNEFPQALRMLKKKDQLIKAYLTTLTAESISYSSKYYLLYANIYEKLNQDHNCFIYAQKGLKSYPDNPNLFLFLCNLYDKYHLYGKLGEFLTQFNDYSVSNIDLILKRIEYEIYYGNSSRVQDLLSQVPQMALNEEDRDSILSIETIYLEQIQFMRDSFHEPIKLKDRKQKPTKLLQKAFYGYILWDYTGALQAVVKLLKIQKSNTMGLFIYGILKLFLDDFNDGLVILSIYDKMMPNNWRVAYAFAFGYANLEVFDKMHLWWNKVCEAQPFFSIFSTPHDYLVEKSTFFDLYGIGVGFIRDFLNDECFF